MKCWAEHQTASQQQNLHIHTRYPEEDPTYRSLAICKRCEHNFHSAKTLKDHIINHIQNNPKYNNLNENFTDWLTQELLKEQEKNANKQMELETQGVN